MVLIFSTEHDYSTGQVIRWLNYYKKPFLRINENDEIILKKLTHNDLTFSFNYQLYSLSEITSTWYRRGNFNIKISPFKDEKVFLKNYINNEIKEIQFHIHNLFKTKRNLNNHNFYHVNKLEVLSYCKENKLNTAPFLITQSKEELLSFYRNNLKIISKAINIPFIKLTGLENYHSYTYKVTRQDIKKLPSYFTPTFFQKYIDKKYEIRTFYIDGKFYSMVILSQNNQKTKVDFRHYDWEKPNRTMPYQLPKSYEKKIIKMLRYFRINCASIDILVSKANNYFVIDINPIGQFGMISTPCNYNLEKLIAEYLINEK